jgi:hypothetical protein
MDRISHLPEITRVYAVIGQVRLLDLRCVPESEIDEVLELSILSEKSLVCKASQLPIALCDIVHFPEPWRYRGIHGASVMPAEEPWYLISDIIKLHLGVVGVDGTVETVMLEDELASKLTESSFYSLSGRIGYSIGDAPLPPGPNT